MYLFYSVVYLDVLFYSVVYLDVLVLLSCLLRCTCFTQLFT